VTLVVRDPVTQIGPIEAHALLSDTDDVPTLLGMRAVLSDLCLHCDIQRNEAYLES
jgi:hypothetical protein